jgi:hypothetical protein
MATFIKKKKKKKIGMATYPSSQTKLVQDYPWEPKKMNIKIFMKNFVFENTNKKVNFCKKKKKKNLSFN